MENVKIALDYLIEALACMIAALMTSYCMMSGVGVVPWWVMLFICLDVCVGLAALMYLVHAPTDEEEDVYIEY